MARYLITFNLTPAYMQAFLKDPSDREAVLRPMAEAAGAILEHLYISTDSMEGVEILTSDNPAGMDALSLAVIASGIVDASTWRVRRIMTSAELAALARRSETSLYRPPGA